MAKVDFELNLPGLNELMKSGEMQGILKQAGEATAGVAGEGFETETVNFMPDTYWLQDGGYDVRYFLEKARNRVRILHLKDSNFFCKFLQGYGYGLGSV